jgi:Asp-tRNA(Asn)/Glu-tRNA(Gln) amidotransferase A subunit family amidase
MREALERGRRHLGFDYARAIAVLPKLHALLDELFFEYEAFVTPAAPGPAPAGRAATGSPIFCSIWTLCGLPAVTLPMLQSNNGLPMGVQLVGKRGDDARLLRTARWLVNQQLD